jgi:poly-gamma-glutamate biosynthesis protein PgsC/CapC
MIQISSYEVAIFVGLCLSLLVEVKFGISPGGIIVPSYIALVMDRPALLVNILLASLVAYLLVKYVLSRWMLIYGKRRFIACIMVALLFKVLLGLLFPLIPFSVFAFSGVGVVASGILANTYFRQGVVLTVGACAATSAVVFLLVWLVGLI